MYVQTNGCYFGLPDVDPWDEKRDEGFHSAAERARGKRHNGAIKRLGKNERAATPTEFRDLLIAMARSVSALREAA